MGTVVTASEASTRRCGDVSTGVFGLVAFFVFIFFVVFFFLFLIVVLLGAPLVGIKAPECMSRLAECGLTAPHSNDIII
jgi:hypothetical protein